MKKTLTLLLLSLIITMNIYSQKKVNADKFYNFTKNYALVKKGMELRFIDTLGNIMPEMKVNQPINSFSFKEYGIQGNGLYISGGPNHQGIKNIKGEYVFKPIFNIKKYHNFFILKPSFNAKKKDLIITNLNGEIIYKETYTIEKQVFPVNNEIFAIRYLKSSIANEYSYSEIKNIKTGETTEKIFTNVFPEVNGLIKAYKYNEEEGANKWGFINTKFKTIIDFVYSNKPGDLIDNRILVKSRDNKFGFIDATGEIIIEPKFLEAKHFVNGYALVKVHKRKFLVSNKAYNYGYRVIDQNGKIVLDLKNLEPITRLYYKKLNPIESNGIIRVKIKNKFSYIQALLDIKSGKIIKTKYNKIHKFNSGLALVEFKDENRKNTFGYINKNGKLILVKGLVSKF